MSRPYVLLGPILLIAACDMADSEPGGGGGGGGAYDDGAEGEGEGEDDEQQPGGGAALTAGVWDDNRNFAWFESYLQEHPGLLGAPTLASVERASAHEEFAGDRPANTDLDIAIVFDTTGSMGDELSYLTAEVESIAADIEAAAPNADVRWSLIVYRDEGDEYVTRVINFTSSLASFQASLADQSFGGGGDYPEASERGLADLAQLSWRDEDDVARLAFWVADAPHHAEKNVAFTDALRAARDLDVHVYPVAASGVDQLAELSMRSAAQLTGGRYLFLTDDSGLGGEHLEPSIPCYFVTLLADAMVRMVDVELTGVYREPTADEIIRVAGDPQDGRCVMGDGTELSAF